MGSDLTHSGLKQQLPQLQYDLQDRQVYSLTDSDRIFLAAFKFQSLPFPYIGLYI